MSLTYLTSCADCPQKFTTPGFADLFATEAGQAKIAQVFRVLVTHLQDNHPKECQKADLSASMLAGLLRLVHFHTEDPAAIQMREWNRHVLHEMTRGAACPDEKIEQQVATLGLDEFTALRVMTLMKQMRDVIEERGPFAPTDPAIGTNGQPRSNLVLP